MEGTPAGHARVAMRPHLAAPGLHGLTKGASTKALQALVLHIEAPPAQAHSDADRPGMQIASAALARA